MRREPKPGEPVNDESTGLTGWSGSSGADRPRPLVIVVGAASRDLEPASARGWRLGGGVAYSALVLARLGLPVGAIVGVDSLAARAPELDLLRHAGVDVRLVPLERGPVFELHETSSGRRLQTPGRSDRIQPLPVPAEWAGATTWLFSPVDDELPDGWAALAPPDALVGLGWQGLLRQRADDGQVSRRPPAAGVLLARADVVGVSRDDLSPGTPMAELVALLRPGAILALTTGPAGGLLAEVGPGGVATRLRSYPAYPADQRDPTGAGDAFLAGFLAARAVPALVGGRTSLAWAARLGAAIGSLIVEGRGLAGVPERAAVRRRLAEVPAG